MSREHYEQQLRSLNDDLLRMGALVETAIGQSIQALTNHDEAMAQEVIRSDDLIDRAQYALEEKALLLFATQQPLVARDLRLVSAIITIASELERVGDYAEGIAKIAIRQGQTPALKPQAEVPSMTSKAQLMLRTALECYTRIDVDLAKTLSAADDEIDQQTDRVQREILEVMIADASTVEQATRLLYVVHNLERIADRATNIGERVVFMATGHMADLNEQRA